MHSWFNLAHVCRWRAVVFASYSHLDINLVVGPEKPGQLKATLSGHFLPILIDYSSRTNGPPTRREITGSALWRMRAALRHRDRVREISFGGWDVDFIETFISATNYPFPALESLVLSFPDGQEPDIPATFLRGSDQSDLPLQHLRLYGGSLPFVSGLLLSATALTDLTLNAPFNAAVGSSLRKLSQESILLACLQGMECLCGLDLTTPHFLPNLPHSTPKDIVPLLKLTRFHYAGSSIFLNNLMSGLSVPSLQDARFQVVVWIGSPFLYLSRVIDELREEFRSISVTFDVDHFCLLSSTQSGEIYHPEPSFSFYVNGFPYSINAVNSPPSTKLAMTEELALNFPCSQMTRYEHIFSMRQFLRQFRSVRVLRVSPLQFGWELGHYLQQDDGEAILPLLEEIELSDKEHQRRVAQALATFEGFASTRKRRAGHPVKVYYH
jgi:hypothetical protein